MLSGAVQPHCQIVPCHSEIRRHIADLVSLDINPLEKLPVLLGHEWQKSFEALTKYSLVFCCRTLRQFFFKAIERATFGPLPAININDRTPEDTVEPVRYFL